MTPTTQEKAAWHESYPNRHGPTKTSGNASFDLSRTQTCHWATCREPDGRNERWMRIGKHSKRPTGNCSFLPKIHPKKRSNLQVWNVSVRVEGNRVLSWINAWIYYLGKPWHGVNTWFDEMVAWLYVYVGSCDGYQLPSCPLFWSAPTVCTPQRPLIFLTCPMSTAKTHKHVTHELIFVHENLRCHR